MADRLAFMLVNCPHCDAGFSVPDNAIGQKGRNLKCARCGEKWFQTPISTADEFGLDETVFPPPPPAPPPPPPPPPSFDDEPESSFSSDTLESDAQDLDADLDQDLDETPPISATLALSGGAAGDKKAKAAEAKKKGSSTFGLWLLFLVFLLVALAGGTYIFQDTLIKYWPAAEEYLIQVNFRHERPGAGFDLKRMGKVDRGVHDDVEVVVIRGIITNISNRTRLVPPLKLVLLDKDDHVVQEKIDKPPVVSLDPGGTSSFVVQLERPDANARTIKLEFVELPPDAQLPPQASAPAVAPTHEGIITPPPAPAATPAPAAETPAPAPAPAVTPPPAAPAVEHAPAAAHPAAPHKEK